LLFYFQIAVLFPLSIFGFWLLVFGFCKFKASVWSTIVSAESEQGRRGDDDDDVNEDLSQDLEFGRDGVRGQRYDVRPSASAGQQDESFYSDDVTPQPRYR